MSNPLHGITRIDHKNTHSWWVRLYYKNRSPQLQKSFSDKKLGGTAKALAAAVIYRNTHINLNRRLVKEKLVWKNRSTKMRRMLQKKHGRKIVEVGTGVAAARKAYDLGMGRVTCHKIRTGRQSHVFVNRGGWQTPEYEDFKFEHDISNKQYEEIKDIIGHYADNFSETEKSEMVSDIMIKLSLGMIENPKRMGSFIKKWVSNRKLRKARPNRDDYSLDINGNRNISGDHSFFRPRSQ